MNRNRIAFQGELGANSHEACQAAFPDMEPAPCATFEEAFEAVRSGDCRLGMIPVENSIAGRVADVHHLLPSSGLRIIGEYFKPIHFQLMANPGVRLEDLKTVVSMPIAFAQCREVIANLGLSRDPVSDTALAARRLSEHPDPTRAAIAPALAAGNSVVLKPSEDASLSLLRLAQLCIDAGLPPGVLNVVTGTGAEAGEALARHMDVDILTFTGSGPVGRLLLKASAESNLKRVYLELGGKSPNVVFGDAPDLAQAAKVSAMGIFRNSGQVCVAGSRLLVQRSVHDEFVDRLQNIAASLRVGDPLDVTMDIGAVSSARQLSRNQSMLARALEQGARLRTGGQVIAPVPGGQYMSPAVLDGVQPEMEIARQEVFGPVLAVMPFDDEAHAVRLANGTEYGLAAGVWTGNLSRAHRMVRAIKAGLVHVNTYGGPDITVPLGGVRQSGNGHDKSMHAMDKYLDLKTAWIQL